MKKISLFCTFFLAVFLSWAQEPPAFPVDNILPGISRYEKVPVFCFPGQGKFLPDSLISVCIAEIRQDSITSYLQSLENFGTRFMLADNHRDVAEWIKNKFISLGYANARLDSFLCITQWPATTGPIDTSWQYNVFATLPGQLNPDVEVISGGHYDAIVYSGGDPYFVAPGADDNGSAIAANLEIARVLKAKNITPSSSITFAAWAGEERGLLGSVDKVIKAMNQGDQIKTYVNMDMVSSDPDTANWDFHVNTYQGSEWLGGIAAEVAWNHTSLSPVLNPGNSSGSDSYGFWLGGFSPVYFEEMHFSPNYHQITDLVVNCNMPYCTEITKVALGTLLTADQLPSKVRYELFNPGTGNSLIPRWRPNPETNLAGYMVRVGYSSSNYHTSFMTVDTALILTNLSPDTLYYIAVSAVADNGYEGPVTEYSDRPALVTLDHGILIVDDSEGGILYPGDSVVDSFYAGLLHDFQYTEYDAYVQQQISLAEMGKYSSILWHINTQTSVTVLNRYLNDVIKYLKLGGNILFTVYQPERAIYKISSYPNQWGDGTFLHDYCGIGLNELNSISRFNAALPESPDYPLLTIDTTKTLVQFNYHIAYIEALWPEHNENILYRYGTAFDTATTQGEMAGRPVGIKCEGQGGWKTVMLSFPLFYMDFAAAKEFTRSIMSDYFGEAPIGIPEPTEKASMLSVFPNPAFYQTRLNFTLKSNTRVSISLYNLLGEKVRNIAEKNYQAGSYSLTLDLGLFPSGLYLIGMETGQGTMMKKLVVAANK